MAAIAIAVLTVVFTTLIKAVNTNQETINAAIRIINSTGIRNPQGYSSGSVVPVNYSGKALRLEVRARQTLPTSAG
jgi:hypothetical protein